VARAATAQSSAARVAKPRFKALVEGKLPGKPYGLALTKAKSKGKTGFFQKEENPTNPNAAT